MQSDKGALNTSSTSEEYVDASDDHPVPCENYEEVLSYLPREDSVTPTPADNEWAMLNDRGDNDQRAEGELVAEEGAADFAIQANAAFITERRVDSTEPLMHSTPVRRSPPEVGCRTFEKPSRLGAGAEGVPFVEPTSPTDLSFSTATMKKPRERQKTVTMKSKLSEALAEAFAILKTKQSSEHIDELERRCHLAAMQSEQEWANRVAAAVAARQEPSPKELEMVLLIKELEESEKLYYDKLVEFASNPAASASSRFRITGGSSSKLQAELDAAIKQRDRMVEEFGTLDNNYSDLFRRYEMLREQSQTLRDNETKLKQEAENMAIKYGKTRAKLEEAGLAAQEMMEKANEEIGRLNAARETDNLALRMKVKQYSSQIASYETAINAKNVENQELQQICDELLQKADINEY